MTTINQLIHDLTPFSDQENMRETIAALNILTITINEKGIENAALLLIDFLGHSNRSLSNIALDGIMTLAQLNQSASSVSPNAARVTIQHADAEAVTVVKSLLLVKLINYSEAPSILRNMENFYAKETPVPTRFFSPSPTQSAEDSRVATSPSLSS